jgi:hypothetical protein
LLSINRAFRENGTRTGCAISGDGLSPIEGAGQRRLGNCEGPQDRPRVGLSGAGSGLIAVCRGGEPQQPIRLSQAIKISENVVRCIAARSAMVPVDCLKILGFGFNLTFEKISMHVLTLLLKSETRQRLTDVSQMFGGSRLVFVAGRLDTDLGP